MRKVGLSFSKLIAIVFVIMLATLVAGCHDESPKPNPLEGTKKLTITAVNLSDVDAGMFSIFNPILSKQVNLGAIASNESMTIELDWPEDEAELKWALYNQKGELCIEATTDITQANDSVTLVMSGSGTIDNIEASF